MSKFIVLILVFSTVGCTTTTGLYSWGNYENDLFIYYHKPEYKDDVVKDQLQFLSELEQKNKKPPPGLLAEAGTMLLLQGDTDKAIQYYEKEADTWPESEILMRKIVSNLKTRK